MLDELSEEAIRQLATQIDGVPVLFVEVIAWHDRVVAHPQLYGTLGVAFERDAGLLGEQRDNREDFAPYLHDQMFLSEGKGLRYVG